MEKRKIFVAPSLLSANFTQVDGAIKMIESAGADWVHLDVMDGTFVPPITFGHKMVGDIREMTHLDLDVHLMVEHPETQISSFVKAGANWITLHYESASHLHRSIMAIKEAGVKAGVAICPATHPMLLEPILADVDLVLVMSVNPGYSGQCFIENSYEKIEWLKRKREEMGYHYLISVDGGVNAKNALALKNVGADAMVSGSSFFSADHPEELVSIIKG